MSRRRRSHSLDRSRRRGLVSANPERPVVDELGNAAGRALGRRVATQALSVPRRGPRVEESPRLRQPRATPRRGRPAMASFSPGCGVVPTVTSSKSLLPSGSRGPRGGSAMTSRKLALAVLVALMAGGVEAQSTMSTSGTTRNDPPAAPNASCDAERSKPASLWRRPSPHGTDPLRLLRYAEVWSPECRRWPRSAL